MNPFLQPLPFCKRAVVITRTLVLSSHFRALFFTLALFSVRAVGQAMAFAEKFQGEDAGAKIVACMGALPPSGGVCDARQLGGQQRSSSGFTVGTSTKPVQLLLGAIELVVSKPIYVQARSSLIGMASASGIGVYQGATIIKSAENANLPAVLEIVGGFAVLQDITVDGGAKNNPRGSSAIRVSNSPRVSMFRVTAQNANNNGIDILSSKPSASCCAKLEHLMSVDNRGSGLLIDKTGDVFVSLSEFEDNGRNGIDVSGSAGIRIEHSDIGGNRAAGILLRGSAALPSSNEIIVGNQFGNNYQEDILISGARDDYLSGASLISANEFVGGERRKSGDANAILISESGYNVISNNSFFAARDHRYQACVSMVGKRAIRNVLAANVCQATEAGSETAFWVTQTTQSSGNYGKLQVRSQ